MPGIDDLQSLVRREVSSAHPLDPLNVEEMQEAVALLRAGQKLSDKVRFMSAALREPTKDEVRAYEAGTAPAREAHFILLDNADGQTYEAVVSLTKKRVMSWKHIPGVQPPIHIDEFIECENAVKASPEWQAALRKRGITDFENAIVDPWSAGNYGDEAFAGHRLARGYTWMRTSHDDVGYGRPVEGVVAIVDLNTMKVLTVEDHGVVPLPPPSGNYTATSLGPLRTDLKPLDIVQLDGPGFTVDGYLVSWQKWKFRVGFTPREGLVLYSIGYEDAERERPILYRASLSEMVVPYGDPGPNHNKKNAFDVGEYGIGRLVNSLELGCDCLGTIKYFDAIMTDSKGGVTVIPKAVCMHEEDYGTLWKHTDWRTNHTEVRRSRRLVVSFIATVGNYDYGFFWYFYQTGEIQLEIKLTGCLSVGALPPDVQPRYGAMVSPQLYAPIHQHFFNFRLHFMVDGDKNSVYEVDTVAEPAGPDNPLGNGCYPVSTLLSRESEAQRVINPLAGRYWKVVNTGVRNKVGQPVGYKLAHGENVLPFATTEASVMKRAGFMRSHLWVTAYDPAELYASGDYINQHAGGDGLPAYVAKDRPLENSDVVVWYTCGHHHIPRPEDWPVMPVVYMGFSLKPVGFFDANPAMDAPPPELRASCEV